MNLLSHINGRVHPRALVAAWAGVGAGLLLLTIGFTAASYRFGFAYQVAEMPVFWLAGGLILAGAVWLLLPPLIRSADMLTPRLAKGLLWAMLLAGLVVRLVLFASEPALEDDYQRYLWDGGVTAHGLNPYGEAPDAAKIADPETMALGRLARDSGLTLGRVNHPDMRTVYPPVAQGAFAVAHWVAPWGLTAWRGVILVCDLVSLALLLMLLGALGRSPLWAALYWWNPIVLKELFNSVHMEALTVPLVVGGLYLAVRSRPLAATASLTLAAGVKIWPLILLPIVWRGLVAAPRRLAAAVALTAGACVLFAWPILSAGLDPSSGLVAYASKWKTNSALFPVIEGAAAWLFGVLSIEAVSPGLVARGLVALALCGVVAWQCRRPATDAADVVTKALVITAAAFLLSPAQFPWYYLWVLPLLACRPVPGLLVLTATLPLYYTAFHYLAIGAYDVYTERIVWLVWLPAWGLLAWEARHRISAFIRPAAPSHVSRKAS